MLAGLAQIAVHKDRSLAALRHRYCEVGSGDAATFIGGDTGDQERLQGRIETGKDQVRAQAAIRFAGCRGSLSDQLMNRNR